VQQRRESGDQPRDAKEQIAMMSLDGEFGGYKRKD
jgi:hypothetical protein